LKRVTDRLVVINREVQQKPAGCFQMLRMRIYATATEGMFNKI
jgi:hypothetical protein